MRMLSRYPATMNHDQQELRNAGLKVTLPRLKILQILEQHQERHLRADEVYKALLDAGEDVGLATVYRVLTQFEAAGLVEKHHFAEGYSVFELASNRHHDHLVCTDCGHIVEFHDAAIEKQQEKIASDLGFQLVNHSHYLYGHCTKKRCSYRESGQQQEKSI